ncbi:MAG: ligase-associated DNA damage response endonuclease PdeM [Deltaproteobacteria bacterium]|nr:MAG: ligase-associated DNA damage response endonuclease PdeM [Deltaproteobacteria bacterium]
MLSASIGLELGGERVELLAHRALWVPARRRVVVADVHLGKEATFRRAGVPLPRGGLEATLAALDHLVRATGAAELLVLGDLIHHADGLTSEVRERVVAWRSSQPVPIRLVRGNHDRAVDRVASAWGVEVIGDHWREGGIVWVHDPGEAEEGIAHVGGHRHPVVRASGPAEAMRFPCFHLGARGSLLVLPAFSRFTGGLPVRRRRGDRVFAVVDRGVSASGLLEVPARGTVDRGRRG